MKPIAPGTLCLIVSPAPTGVRGRCVTVTRVLRFHCTCGAPVYQFEPAIGDADACCQTVLKPILPPGVNTGIEHTEDLRVQA